MDELYVASRRTLLDALEALADQGESVILIGAHAVYVYTGEADVPIATRTKDSDLALDPSQLEDSPLLEEVMGKAGFQAPSRAVNQANGSAPTGFRLIS